MTDEFKLFEKFSSMLLKFSISPICILAFENYRSFNEFDNYEAEELDRSLVQILSDSQDLHQCETEKKSGPEDEIFSTCGLNEIEEGKNKLFSNNYPDFEDMLLLEYENASVEKSDEEVVEFNQTNSSNSNPHLPFNFSYFDCGPNSIDSNSISIDKNKQNFNNLTVEKIQCSSEIYIDNSLKNNLEKIRDSNVCNLSNLPIFKTTTTLSNIISDLISIIGILNSESSGKTFEITYTNKIRSWMFKHMQLILLMNEFNSKYGDNSLFSAILVVDVEIYKKDFSYFYLVELEKFFKNDFIHRIHILFSFVGLYAALASKKDLDVSEIITLTEFASNLLKILIEVKITKIISDNKQILRASRIKKSLKTRKYKSN